MPTKVLPEARDDLRRALQHYRAVTPPALGKQLAARMMSAFKEAIGLVAGMPLSRPEHPDIPGARWVALQGFPYLVFYAVVADAVVVVAVEYATRDYVSRVTRRARGG